MENSSWHVVNRHVEKLLFPLLIVLKIQVENGGVRARSPSICRPRKLRNPRWAHGRMSLPWLRLVCDQDIQANGECFSPGRLVWTAENVTLYWAVLLGWLLTQWTKDSDKDSAAVRQVKAIPESQSLHFSILCLTPPHSTSSDSEEGVVLLSGCTSSSYWPLPGISFIKCEVGIMIAASNTCWRIRPGVCKLQLWSHMRLFRYVHVALT